MAVIKRYSKQHAPLFRPKSNDAKKRALAQRVLFLHQLGPIFLVGVGLFLLASVIVPVFFSGMFSQTEIQVDATDRTDEIFFISRENLLPTPIPTPQVIATELNFTDLADWFPQQELPIIAPQEARKYLLSIPKLNIEDAEVVYGGRNLDEHLIQYPSTGMPGDIGTPVIFGHSILRQFYNPAKDNPRRYISIFSKIMTLKSGDPIYIHDGTITYTYRVTTKIEVMPTDRFILDQQDSARELKLVTCTPEGTTLRRGVVTAVLDEN